MTKQELLNALKDGYIDQNGLVKSQLDQHDSDNGVLFSSIAQILTESNCFQDSIDKCYLKPGLLSRKPVPAAQEQFDDFLGRAIACIFTDNTKEPREILLYGLLHGFVFNTDKNLELKDFLGRFPIVFTFMFAAAFPKLKYLVYPLLTLYCRNLNPPDLSNSSGLQLQLLMIIGYHRLFKNDLVIDWLIKLQFSSKKTSLDSIFSTYYGKDHPYTKFIELNYQDFVTSYF